MTDTQSRIGFLRGFAFAHREAFAFLIACPLIVAIPVLVEFAQHAIEMRIGMYDGPDGAQAAESHPLRMGFGFVKTLAISIMGYPVVRFLAGGRDAAAARTLDQRAVGLFALVLGLQAVLSALGLFVFPANDSLGIGFFIFGMVFGPLVARFVVAAPLGVWISPLASIRQMLPHIVFAVLFSLVAMLPMMALHYALGIGAIFVGHTALQWAMLAIDSVLVGVLAALLVAIQWVVALRAGPIATDR